MTLEDWKALAMRDVSPTIHYPVVMVLGIALFAASYVAWLIFAPTDPVGQVVIATPAKEVRAIPRVDTVIKSGKVAVYKGGKPLKKKLNLPQPIVDDPKQEVLASSVIPAGEHPHTVTTTINTDTGASETYVRTDELPWLGYENRGEVGIFYGVKSGERVVRLQARQDFVQVKALHMGVIASIDSGLNRSTFIGIGVAFKW
jgi:hypothetical protein